MVQLLMLAGLFFIILSMLLIFFPKATAEDPQQPYVFKGLALSAFAVGAFSVGNWLVGALFANALDDSYATLGGWIFAVPMMLLFIGLSDKWNPGQVLSKVKGIGYNGAGTVSKAKVLDVRKYGYRSRIRRRYPV